MKKAGFRLRAASVRTSQASRLCRQSLMRFNLLLAITTRINPCIRGDAEVRRAARFQPRRGRNRYST